MSEPQNLIFTMGVATSSAQRGITTSRGGTLGWEVNFVIEGSKLWGGYHGNSCAGLERKSAESRATAVARAGWVLGRPRIMHPHVFQGKMYSSVAGMLFFNEQEALPLLALLGKSLHEHSRDCADFEQKIARRVRSRLGGSAPARRRASRGRRESPCRNGSRRPC